MATALAISQGISKEDGSLRAFLNPIRLLSYLRPDALVQNLALLEKMIVGVLGRIL